MATLVKDEKGNFVRYRLTPTVDEGHATLEGLIASRTYDASGGRSCQCREAVKLSSADESALLAEIKKAVAGAIPAVGTLSTAKYEAEYWINSGHTTIEAEAFAYPTVKYAADGPVAASEEKIVVKWVPSVAVKAALLAAAKV